MFMLCLYGIGAETETTLMDAYQIYATAENNGKTGSSAELTLNMKNRNLITMWTCTLVLPTGVTFSEAKLVYDRIPDGYNPVFEATPNNDGTVSFTCSGEDGVTLLGTDGPIATITVDIDSAVEPGNYAVTVKNAMLEDLENMHQDQRGERIFTWTIEQGIVYATITFDLGGAPGEYAPITAPVGDAIDAPDDPEWEGHNFLGWDKPFPETMPEGGLLLTAQWELKKFKVYVEGDGVQIENPEPEWGGTVVILVEEFSDRVLEALYVNQRNVIDLMEGNTYTINDVQYDIYVNAVFRTTKTTITIEQDYTPYSSAYDLDFSGSDLKAYIAAGFNKETSQAVLVNVTDVPAYTGVLLIGKAGEYTIPQAQTSSYFVNLFRPFVDGGLLYPYADDQSVNYIYAVVEGDPGFYRVTDGTPGATANGAHLPANSAYLSLPANVAGSAVKVGFIFEDDVIDGINEVNGEWSMVNGQSIYNLAGQRLQKMQKGINIVNGKKILK